MAQQALLATLTEPNRGEGVPRNTSKDREKDCAALFTEAFTNVDKATDSEQFVDNSYVQGIYLIKVPHYIIL
jgi:hypothetical protein